jgi:hypothetical protein
MSADRQSTHFYEPPVFVAPASRPLPAVASAKAGLFFEGVASRICKAPNAETHGKRA